MAHLAPLRQRYYDANGEPLAGGKLYTYAAGTSTPLATYQNKAESTSNTNPVILDANGEADVWIGANAYKFVLKNSLDITQWTIDNISFLNDDSITTDKLVDDILSADNNGRAKMEDGFFSADAVGLAKFEDGFLSADAGGLAKMADEFFTADSDGRAKFEDGFINREMLPAVGQQVSSSSGSFLTSSGTLVDVTNLSVSITTTGGPVVLALIWDGNGSSAAGGFSVDSTASTGRDMQMAYLRGSTLICKQTLGNDNGFAANPGTTQFGLGFPHIDVVDAGTYTYKVRINLGAGSQANAVNMKLIAFEL